MSDRTAIEKHIKTQTFMFLWYNIDAYLENVIPLLIKALSVAGSFLCYNGITRRMSRACELTLDFLATRLVFWERTLSQGAFFLAVL